MMNLFKDLKNLQIKFKFLIKEKIQKVLGDAQFASIKDFKPIVLDKMKMDKYANFVTKIKKNVVGVFF